MSGIKLDKRKKGYNDLEKGLWYQAYYPSNDSPIGEQFEFKELMKKQWKRVRWSVHINVTTFVVASDGREYEVHNELNHLAIPTSKDTPIYFKMCKPPTTEGQQTVASSDDDGWTSAPIRKKK